MSKSYRDQYRTTLAILGDDDAIVIRRSRRDKRTERRADRTVVRREIRSLIG